MKTKDIHTPDQQFSRFHESTWKALFYFSIYRIGVCLLLYLLLLLGDFLNAPQKMSEDGFITTLIGYSVAACVLLIATKRRSLQLLPLTIIQTIIDICALTLLIYLSYGLASGYGMLTIIAIAGNSILVNRKLAIFFAAIASLVILATETYVTFSVTTHSSNFFHAGFLGMAFFLVSLTAQHLARRARLGEQYAEALRQLSELNEGIVDRMSLGVVVIDAAEYIRLCNRSARTILQLGKDTEKPLCEVSMEIYQALQHWQQDGINQSESIYLKQSGKEILPTFFSLDSDEISAFSTLIYIEDVVAIKEQAQNMKLASLGSLTASIAHEIRNPLAAISNAAQLLQESDKLTTTNRRLANITQENTIRVNRIIENVLNISRHKSGPPAEIELGNWLQKFILELRAANQLQENDLSLQRATESVLVRVDETQLHQIVWNLAENGIRYSNEAPLLRFSYGMHAQNRHCWLDITDSGNGIPEELQQRLFEPFMTTEKTGSGMGLYIAHELCQANHANLVLHYSSEQGSCFRIDFRDPGIMGYAHRKDEADRNSI